MPEQTALDLARIRAPDTEALGSLHPEVTRALTDAGMLRRWVAAECGGEAASVTDGLRTIEATAKADGAAGWCVMIANTTALTSHRVRSDWAETIYRDPAACTGGFGMPAGTATLVDGGLEVTGRWAWGSGTDHCTWIGGGVRVVDAAGEKALTGDGAFAPFVFFDPSDVELLDTWHVAGLKGTASTDYAVSKAFVPEGRWANLLSDSPVVDSPLGRFPFFGALGAGVAACLIGLGERAIEEIVALAVLIAAAWGVRRLSRRLAGTRAVRGRPALRTALASVGGPGGEATAVVLATSTSWSSMGAASAVTQ